MINDLKGRSDGPGGNNKDTKVDQQAKKESIMRAVAEDAEHWLDENE